MPGTTFVSVNRNGSRAVKTAAIHVHAEPHVAERVKAAADADGRTVSAWALRVLLARLDTLDAAAAVQEPQAAPVNPFAQRRQEAHERELARHEAGLREQQADDRAWLLRQEERQ